MVVSDGNFHNDFIRLCAQIYQKIREETGQKWQFGNAFQILAKALTSNTFNVIKLLKSSIVNGDMQFTDNQLTLN